MLKFLTATSPAGVPFQALEKLPTFNISHKPVVIIYHSSAKGVTPLGASLRLLIFAFAVFSKCNNYKRIYIVWIIILT